MLACVLFIASCGGSPPKTVREVVHTPCPRVLPPLTCDLAACPDRHTLTTPLDLQDAYLRCQDAVQCHAEWAGQVKRLHDPCTKE